MRAIILPPRNPSASFRILYESDWLVNAEDFPGLLADSEKTERFIGKNFATEAGIRRARRLFLNDDSLFARMGNVYKLMIDEGKRAAVEQPYLAEMAEAARRKRPKASAWVLDLACGTGFHSRLLAGEGYPVIGIDASRSMLAAAERVESAGRIQYREGDLLKPLPLDKEASLVLLLGNTLSLFSSRDQVETVLGHAAKATGKGGILLVQILNYRRLSASAVTKHGIVDGRETILTKSLQTTNDGRVALAFTASQKSPAGEWRTESESTLLQPWACKDIERAAKKVGFALKALRGSMRKSEFDAENSADCVFQFVRSSAM